MIDIAVTLCGGFEPPDEDEWFREWAHNNMPGKKGFQTTGSTDISGEPVPIESLSGGGAGTLKTPWVSEPVADRQGGGRWADSRAKAQGMALESYAEDAVAARMRDDPAVIDALVAIGPVPYGSFGISNENLAYSREGARSRIEARRTELEAAGKTWHEAHEQAVHELASEHWSSLTLAQKRDYAKNGIPNEVELAERQKKYLQEKQDGLYDRYPQYDKGFPTDMTRLDQIGGFGGVVHTAGQSWFDSSGNGRSIALQLAARDEFRLSGAPTSRFQSAPKLRLGLDEYARAGPLLRAYARHMYENTQAEFAAAGITHVNLARGLRGVSQRGSTSFTSQPISSWTASSMIAKKFGSSVAYARFPVSWVLATPRTGFGLLPELEVTILGARPYRAHVIDNPGYVAKPGMPEGPSPEVGE
jgi:hypothetical protein